MACLHIAPLLQAQVRDLQGQLTAIVQQFGEEKQALLQQVTALTSQVAEQQAVAATWEAEALGLQVTTWERSCMNA